MPLKRDDFARENLPPKTLWPELINIGTEPFCYPHRLNCAVELLDNFVSQGNNATRPLFHSTSHVWTYGEFLETTNRFARVLTEDLGLIPGNRVLLRGPNSPLLAATWFAVLKAGGICVTSMPLLRGREISYICDKASIKLCLCDERWAADAIEATKHTTQLAKIVYFESTQSDSLEQLAEKKPTTFENVSTSAEDVALIAFTSGTTGRAKATMHFHRDVLTICDAFPRSVLKPTGDDIFCGTPPFAFTFGLGALLLFPMRFGASSILLEKPTPESVAQAVERYRGTILFTSPTGYRAMAEHVKLHDISSLRKCVSAGEVLPASTFKMWAELTGIRIIDGIGSTEMLHIFISADEDSLKPGSTGKPIHGYEAKIIDNAGHELPNNTIGLLAVRGPTGCRYLDDDRQKEYVRFGWNVTGDAYLRDNDGYYWFQSRADDMIISSGYNISGIEIESTILRLPEVKECAVVGVPDADRGQIVKAFIVLKEPGDGTPETIKKIQNFVKAEIAPYKYPRAVQFCEDLPKTETGKLQRFKLREL